MELRSNKSFQKLVDMCHNRLVLEELCGKIIFRGVRGDYLRERVLVTCEKLLGDYYSTDPYDKDFEYVYTRLTDRLYNSRVIERWG